MSLEGLDARVLDLLVEDDYAVWEIVAVLGEGRRVISALDDLWRRGLTEVVFARWPELDPVPARRASVRERMLRPEAQKQPEPDSTPLLLARITSRGRDEIRAFRAATSKE